MDALECILTRHSVREFKDELLSCETMDKLKECGLAAPKAGGFQDVRVDYTNERTKIQFVGIYCGQPWIMSAGGIFIVSANPTIGFDKYGLRGVHLYIIQNAAAVCENILLAAHAMDLGACWVGAFNEPAIRNIMLLKDADFPQAVIVVGNKK